MNHNLLMAIIIMICAGAILTIIQIWVPIFAWDIFVKVIATLVILTVLAALILVLKSDLGSHKKMKDENYLD